MLYKVHFLANRALFDYLIIWLENFKLQILYNCRDELGIGIAEELNVLKYKILIN